MGEKSCSPDRQETKTRSSVIEKVGRGCRRTENSSFSVIIHPKVARPLRIVTRARCESLEMKITRNPAVEKRGCNFHRRVIDRLFRPFNFMRSRAAYVNRSTTIALEHRCSKILECRKCMADCDRASNVSTFPRISNFFFLNKNRLNRLCVVNRICFSALRRYHRY